MKHLKYILISVAASACLAGLVSAQDMAPAARDPTAAAALDNAMTPGAGQARLDAMIGAFDVTVLTWADPVGPPVEDTLSCVNTWVLDNRYVRTTLAGHIDGQPFNGVGYYGYDNVSSMYEAVWMDTGSTGMTVYRGGFDASGTNATLTASVINPVTGGPSTIELRIAFGADGDHVTEMWGTGLGDTPFKMMELRHTRKSD